MKTKKSSAFTGLFNFLLVWLLGVLALMLITVGIQTYKNTVDKMNCNAQVRTSLQYIITKFEQSPKDVVYLTQLENTSAIALEENIENQIYVTYIYFYDGALRELQIKKGAQFGPQAGEFIAAINNFEITEVEEGLFRFKVTTSDKLTHEVIISTVF